MGSLDRFWDGEMWTSQRRIPSGSNRTLGAAKPTSLDLSVQPKPKPKPAPAPQASTSKPDPHPVPDRNGGTVPVDGDGVNADHEQGLNEPTGTAAAESSGETDDPSPGWYPDPNGLPCSRRWDGTTWTEQTRPLATGNTPRVPASKIPDVPASETPDVPAGQVGMTAPAWALAALPWALAIVMPLTRNAIWSVLLLAVPAVILAQLDRKGLQERGVKPEQQTPVAYLLVLGPVGYLSARAWRLKQLGGNVMVGAIAALAALTSLLVGAFVGYKQTPVLIDGLRVEGLITSESDQQSWTRDEEGQQRVRVTVECPESRLVKVGQSFDCTMTFFVRTPESVDWTEFRTIPLPVTVVSRAGDVSWDGS